jgi:preprotein translocase subunit SecG
MPCSVSSSSKALSRALKVLGIGFILLIVFGSILKMASPEKSETDDMNQTERQNEQKKKKSL